MTRRIVANSVRKYFIRLMAAAVFLAFAPPVQSSDNPASDGLIKIPRGITTADIDGDGKPEIILNMSDGRNRRDTAQIIMFMRMDYPAIEPLATHVHTGGVMRAIGIRPVADEVNAPSLWMTGHSNCAAGDEDHRLLFERRGAILVSAWMTHYAKCKKDAVRFAFYRIVKARWWEIGVEKESFEKFREWTTPTKYMNVEDAFRDNDRRLVAIALKGPNTRPSGH